MAPLFASTTAAAGALRPPAVHTSPLPLLHRFYRVIRVPLARTAFRQRHPWRLTNTMPPSIQQRGHAGRADACHDAVLSQVPSQRVNEHCPLPHHRVAALVEHQHRLLLDGLRRHAPYRRARHRLGVGCVGFPALHLGLHIGRRHQPHVVPQRHQLPRPMMRRGTCLNAN